MIRSKFENIKIAGIACAVPPTKDILIEKYAGIFGVEIVEKFTQMTGVVSRHYTSKYQTASDLAYEAGKHLLQQKSYDSEKIGALIFVTQTPDYFVPATACVMHKRLGLSKDCLTYDINLGCSGYIFGIQTIASLMSNSNIESALLLVGDTSTKTYAPEDRSSCMLFGEAGSATLLEKTSNAKPIDTTFRTDGNGFKAIIIPAGAYRNVDASHERTLWADGNVRSDFDLFMNGTDVFNFTISEVPKLINEFMADTQTTSENYDSVIMHQANHFILKQVAKRCKIPMEKVPISLDRYGNTSVTINSADTIRQIRRCE
jgi:3-oxoacyl-[acyl-carrier-protein] synthase III